MSTTKPQAKPAVLPDEEFNKKWDQENLYQNVKRANDPRFGDITIVKNSTTNEILFVKEKMASSKNEASNDIRELKSRIALNHPHLQRLVNYSTAVKKELCSTHYLSRGFYEFPRSDTQKELMERKRNLSGFTSSELTHLAYQVLDGLNHLHSRNITHGDIRPLNIGSHKAANHFQILDRLADPSPLEKLQASNIINKKELYISPELWRKLQGKDKTLKYSAYKNDLYALGLTILFLGTGDSVQDVYRPSGEFDQNRLDEHIAVFNGKFQNENPYLCTIVKTLLAPQEADRPDSQQLVGNLISYEEYKVQEADNFRSLGAVGGQAQAQSQSYTPQQTQGGFFAPQALNDSQQRIIINRGEAEQPKNYNNFSNLNSTNDNANVTYTYGQPTTTYSYSQPTTYTTQGQPVTYTAQATPETNYVTGSNANVTYSYGQPTTTYGQPTTTYSYAQQPTTTYSYAQQPATYTAGETVTYSQQPTTYTTGENVTYSQQPTTYVQSDPVNYTQGTTTYTQGTTTYIKADGTSYTQPTSAYLQGEAGNYTQGTTTYTQGTTTYAQPTTTYSQGITTYAQPTTTYVTSEPSTYTYVKPNATFVNASIEGGKIERKSYTTYTTPIERKSYTQYVTGAEPIKTIRRSYVHYATDATPRSQVTYVTGQPTTYVTDATPRSQVTYVTGQPTTYVTGQPTTYTSYAQPTTYLAGTPTTYTSYAQPTTTVYSNYISNSTLSNAERRVEGDGTATTETRRVVYQNTTEPQYVSAIQGNPSYSYSTTQPSYVTGEQRVLDGNVEIRKGSYAPPQTETRTVKKRYIIEGDKVIEVEDNESEHQRQEQQYQQPQAPQYPQQQEPQYRQSQDQQFQQNYEQQN